MTGAAAVRGQVPAQPRAGLDAEVAVRHAGFALDVPVRVGEAEVVAVLGPNGAGKSTLLRALAGLLPLTAGRVAVDGVVLDDPATGRFVPAERRPVGLVFQDYLLFPHLSVRENVAFAPRCAGVGRAEARRRADRWLDRFGLLEVADQRPRSLSGGQAQRVALARTLAAEPRLLLLDEPLGALDAGTRLSVRAELRDHLFGYGQPALVVTHDPVEAMVLADRLLVIERGERVQEGTPAEVARRPRTEYVAGLMGLNLYRGAAAGGVVELDGGGRFVVAEADAGPVLVAVRPAAVAVHTEPPHAASPRNAWPGTVTEVERHGDRVRLVVAGVPAVRAEVTPLAVAELGLVPGRSVWVSVKATELEVYPAGQHAASAG